jgi:hypothetical protein
MAFRRPAPALAILGLVAILASLSGTGCGDNAEQKELKAYCDWLEEQDEVQAAVLQPIDLDRGTLMTFANGLGPLIESGNFAQILKAAKSAQASLARIRDEVKPGYDAFAKKIGERSIKSATIEKVHARFLRSAELRARGIDTLAGVADRIDELLAVDTGSDDSARKAELQKLQPPIQAGVKNTLLALFGSDDKLLAAWKRARSAVTGAGVSGGRLLADADKALVAQGAVIQELQARLAEVKGMDGLAPVLLTVEKVLVPKFASAVEIAGKCELPEGEARAAWAEIMKLLRARQTALKGLGELRKSVDRYCDLLTGMPEARILDMASRILRILPQPADDLRQGSDSYLTFTEKVRGLRAQIL